jgi:cytochrome d ubiquinol oxidase subunit II
VIAVVAFLGFSLIETDLLTDVNIIQVIALAASVIALLSVGYFVYKNRFGLGFIGTGVTVVGVVALVFGGLFPRVMPSSLGSAFDLTIYNASSSPYTLQVMSVVALIFVPLVLLYQGWTYYVFRERVTAESHLEY